MQQKIFFVNVNGVLTLATLYTYNARTLHTKLQRIVYDTLVYHANIHAFEAIAVLIN